MDNEAFDRAVADAARDAIMSTIGSVNGAAKEAGIPYATLDRKLRGVSSFTVSELRRLAAVTGKRTSDFIPKRVA